MTVRRRLGVDMPKRGIQFVARRQGSSAVEQGTHKPLVGSSILPSGIFVGLGSVFLAKMRAAPKAFGVGREFESLLWHSHFSRGIPQYD
jgi:hypothetical protein